MSEQVGIRGFIDGMKREGPNWAKILPQLPRLMHDYLAPDDERIKADEKALRELRRTVRHQKHMLWVSISLATLALAVSAALFIVNAQP